MITVGTALAIAVVLVPMASAQPRPDSARRRPPIITTREAVIIGGGVIAAAALDLTIRDFAQTNRSAATNDAASVGNSLGTVFVAGPALLGAGLVGLAVGEPSVARAALWAAASAGVAGGITAVIKAGVGRARPTEGGQGSFHPLSGNHSFPSGHTSFAFAIASSLAHSTRDAWSDVGFYGLAALTGWSRINHDRHWTSDVVAGAALGWLIGRQLTLRRTRLTPTLTPAGPGIALDF